MFAVTLLVADASIAHIRLLQVRVFDGPLKVNWHVSVVGSIVGQSKTAMPAQSTVWVVVHDKLTDPLVTDLSLPLPAQ